jgi:hypothetical protein
VLAKTKDPVPVSSVIADARFALDGVPIHVNTPVPNVIAACLPLNVLQSAELNAPRLVALAVGIFKVIVGVVVEFETVELTSDPEVPSVRAETEVTVPLPPADTFDHSAVVAEVAVNTIPLEGAVAAETTTDPVAVFNAPA